MKLQVGGKSPMEDLIATFRSDELANFRHLMALAQRQFPFFKLPPRLYLVPDTNCLLKEIDYACRRRLEPGRTALEEVVDAGLVCLFAPTEVEAEVLEHIPGFAAARGGDPVMYFAEWERYRKKIHLFRAEDDAPVDISDPDDACLLRASRIVGADAVITDDEVVLRATRSLKPPAVQRQLRAVSRDEAVRLGLSVYGVLAAIISGGALKWIVTFAWRKPKIAIPILLAAGVGLFLYDRKAVRDTGTSAIRDALGATGRGLEALMTTIEERAASVANNLGAVGANIGPAAVRPLEKIVLATLVSVGKPRTLSEVLSDVQIEGYDPWGASPQQSGETQKQWMDRAWNEFGLQVSRILRSDPCCFRTGTGWTTHLLPNQPSSVNRTVTQLRTAFPALPAAQPDRAKAPAPEIPATIVDTGAPPQPANIRGTTPPVRRRKRKPAAGRKGAGKVQASKKPSARHPKVGKGRRPATKRSSRAKP
jgi:hypothetical protein